MRIGFGAFGDERLGQVDEDLQARHRPVGGQLEEEVDVATLELALARDLGVSHH